MNHPGRPVVELDFQEQFRKAILGISVTRREDGSFVAVNPAFARMFGYGSVEEFMAAVRDVRNLYADPEERARVVATLERHGEVRDLEVRMRRRDGELRWIGGCLLALEGGLIQAAVLDTTDKRLARERELELQGLEHLVTLRFSQARNLGEALRSAMRAICETERWEAARYVYVDEERGVLRAGESWCIDDPQRKRYLEESRTMEYRPGQGLLGHVWKTGEPLWVPDIGADPRVARPGMAARTGMRGSVVFPVHAEGKTIGVLIFDSREVREPDDRLMRALTVIGGQIGLLVRRLQAEQALRESEARFRSLSELSSDWFWETDAAHRFTSPPTRIMEITGYGAAHYVGRPRWEVEGLSPLSGDWQAHRAVLERRESFRDLELLHLAQGGGRRYLSISGGPVHGPDGEFRGYRGTAKDISERKREEELLRLEHAATRCLSEAASEAEGLAGVLREICQSQGWEAGRYFTADDAAGVLRFVEAWGRDTPEVREHLERSRGRTYARGEGLSGWAWEKEAPVWVADVSRDPRASGSAGRLRGGSMVLPVRSQGRVIGVLSFARAEQSAPDDRLLKGLNSIASQLGLFIQRVRGEAAVAASARKFRALIEHGSDAIVLYDRELRMTYRSGSAERITGYSEGERLGGGFFDGVVEEDRPAMQAIVDTLLQASGRSAPFRCRVQHKHGEPRWIEGVATNLLDEPAVGALVVNYRDVDDRMRYESRIEHLASHDALTGLPNRNLLRDRVEQAIAQARRMRGHVALMYVDLDQFKLVNDSYGHRAGDALLLEIGERLRATIREGDTVARLGGDEFVVLLTSLSQADDCTVVASKIAAALARPISVGARELQATASIGIALFPEDGGDLESLLQCADVAMYRAKEAGRNGYQYYSAEMGAHARARVELETGLRRALERGELRLHWQPQVQLASGAVSGCEALLRWDRPARGLVSPAQFIPVAEESGLIVPIGAWALHHACQEAASWAAAGLGRVKVAVNLSARQFWQGSVVETVRAALGESGLDPDCLELEITESVVARDIDKVVKALEQLRRMGVSTAIDDFGTGYSSLAYLRTLPIQKLKIDRYFIEGIPGDREAAALVAEIVRLAHVLSLEVVAEGVETHAQAAFLRDAGCEAMQGFLFSRPVPGADFASLLRSRRTLVINET